MAVGDIAIVPDTTGGETPANTESGSNLTNWGTPTRNDGSTYSVTSGTNLTTSETGNYLVIAKVRTDGTSGTRGILHTHLEQGGVDIAGSFCGKVKDQAATDVDMICQSMALVLNAQLDVRVKAGGDTNGPGDTVANQSFLQAVRLPDDGDAEYLHVGTPTADAHSGSTYNEVDGWDVIRETDDTVVDLDTTNRTDIRLKESGRTYLVIYSLKWDSGGDANDVRVMRATLDGTPIEGSYSTLYLANNNTEWPCCAAMFVVRTTSADQVLSIEGSAVGSGTPGTAFQTVSAGSGLFVCALPSGAEILVAHDSTGAQRMDASSPIDINAVGSAGLVNDSAAFTRGGDTAADIVKAEDILLMSNGYVQNVGNSTNFAGRTDYLHFEIEGANQDEGEAMCFYRRNSSTATNQNNKPVGGWNMAQIYGATANDTVNVEATLETTGNPDRETVGDAVGICMLNLTSIIPSSGTTHDVAAQLDATSSESLDVDRFWAAAGALAATSAENLEANRVLAAAGVLDATSSESLTAENVIAAAAALAASSSESLTLERVLAGAALLAATSSESLDATRIYVAAATLAATSSESLTLERILQAAAALAATSSESLTADRVVAVAAALAATSSESLDVDLLANQLDAAAVLAATSAESLDVDRFWAAAAQLDASSSESLTVETVVAAAAALAATSSESLTVENVLAVAAVLPATSSESLDVDLLANTVDVAAVLAATSSESLAVDRFWAAAAVLAATSLESLQAENVVALAGSLAATSSESLTLERVQAIAANLPASSAESLEVSLYRDAAAALAATSSESLSIDQLKLLAASLAATSVAVLDLDDPNDRTILTAVYAARVTLAASYAARTDLWAAYRNPGDPVLANQDLTAQQGSRRTFRYVAQDTDGSPKNLSSVTLELRIGQGRSRNRITIADGDLTRVNSAGTLDAVDGVIPAGDCARLSPGRYVATLWDITDPADPEAIASGTLTIQPV